jgi:GDPmannose 4,6-dehydratase
MPKKVLIFGCSGQDGSYLAELLIEKGYEVHGAVRRVAQPNRLSRIAHLEDRITLHPVDLTCYASVRALVEKVEFDECYHLAAQSFVSESFADPFTTMNVNINGTHYLLESIRQVRPKARFYFAGSSEMFGQVAETPQTESTPFHPRSPYAISKVAGFDLTRNYREAYGLHASSGILFNHESPRRGEEFVTRKITRAVARIKAGRQKVLRLGNLQAKRDWGFAKEYVWAMWMMLGNLRPDDYVIATGQAHSVRDFCQEAFQSAGLNWQHYVQVDPANYRPAEVDLLVGNPAKAKRVLGWNPETTFSQLVSLMVHEDIKLEAS